jgi:hypothetical protein
MNTQLKNSLFSTLFLLKGLIVLGQSSTIPFIQVPVGATSCSGNIPAAKKITSNGYPDEVDVMGCFMPRANTEVWTIVKPDVTHAEVSYPDVLFRKGDLVSIAAGGGVQVGGSGLTWKRYVNPTSRSRGLDDQYYGSISIPGVLTQQKLASAIQNSPFKVDTDPGANGYLHLQYNDDNYSDNGYWKPDVGWYEQCREMHFAWVVIIIKHNCAGSSEPACGLPAPLDVVTSSIDVNGLPQNPPWGWQTTVGSNPQVSEIFNFSFKSGGMPEDGVELGTHQFTEKDTNGACAKDGTYGRVEGHINWQRAVYKGALKWGDHGLLDRGGDDDYNFHLFTKREVGYTTENQGLQIEFNSKEVIDRAKSKWWNQFHQAVDRQDGEIRALAAVTAYADEMLVDRGTAKRDSAIVIGLLGIDMEHGPGMAELHPAYLMAIHVKDDPNDDVWTFFARNWGNEGFCSSNDHPLPLNTLTLSIPPPKPLYENPEIVTGPGLTEIEFSDPWAMSYNFNATSAGGNLVLNLLPPEKKSLVDGEIHLVWKRSTLGMTDFVEKKVPLEEVTERAVHSPGMGGMIKIKVAAFSTSADQVVFAQSEVYKQIMITNPTDAVIKLQDFQIEGNDASGFRLIKGYINNGRRRIETPFDCSNRALAPKESCSFVIARNNLGGRALHAELKITSDSGTKTIEIDTN